MTPGDIDGILQKAANRPGSSIDDEAMRRVLASLPQSLRPAHSIAPAWVFASASWLTFAGIAVGGAAVLGMAGTRALSGPPAAAVFSTLGIAAGLSAVAIAREMRPAGGRQLSIAAFVAANIGLQAAITLAFSGYDVTDFVFQGIPCLRTGLAFAVPAAIILWALMRRGFILNRSMAGLAAGTLAGLAGIGMLELHCPNLKAIHIMVWHLGVVLLSGLAGWGFGLARRT